MPTLLIAFMTACTIYVLLHFLLFGLMCISREEVNSNGKTVYTLKLGNYLRSGIIILTVLTFLTYVWMN